MKKSMNMEESLNMLKAWKERSTDMDYSKAWKIGHALAEEKYPAAKDFFVQGLEDPNWRWRDDCVSFLGFHYLLEDDILERIRNLLLSDSSSNVRISSAVVLGKQSSLPDPALFSALQSDTNHFVRESAFESILKLAGIANKNINNEMNKLRAGKIQLDLFEIKRIVRQEGIQLPDHYLDQ